VPAVTSVLPSPLRIVAGGQSYGLFLYPEEAAKVLGEARGTVRRQCAAGALPTLPRRTEFEPWRIITGQLFDLLGVPYEVTREARTPVTGAPTDDPAQSKGEPLAPQRLTG
jgi:hypothetical protein